MSELDDLQKTAVDALWVLTAEQRREVLQHFCSRCYERVFDTGGHRCHSHSKPTPGQGRTE